MIKVLFSLVFVVKLCASDNTSDNSSDENFRSSRFLPYPNYSQQNTWTGAQSKPQDTYDFIIVGSGSAGAALANRLSENREWNILLLEAGDVATPLTEIPAMAPVFQFTKLDWNYTAERDEGFCRGCPNQQMHWPRGRALGGTTVINYMIHVRGNPLDYDKWEAMGNPGWGYRDVLPYFKKLEDADVEIEDSEYRNKGGPIAVTDIPYRTESVHSFIKAAQEAGHPYVDYNGKQQLGVSYVQGNLKNGKRCSVEKAYLRPARNRTNLRILTNARVLKVLIDEQNKKAYGVLYVRNKKYYKARAKKEIILSAGAFNSPQLLMLSGIGPKDHLQELDIPVLVDLPVGQKMYDHVTFIGLNFIVNKSIVSQQSEFFKPLNFLTFLTAGTGVLTSLGGVEALLYHKTIASREAEAYPDIEYIFVGGSIASDKGAAYGPSLSVSKETYMNFWKDLEDKYVWTLLPMLIHPRSYGYLKLKSKNPFQWPKFYPKYFSDTENHDIKTFIAAIREAQRINSMPAMQKYGSILYDKSIPGCENHIFNSDPYWKCALRTVCPTLHHQTTTCKMGPPHDPEAVVDHRLKVYGVDRLRVADTSIIPSPLSAHTNIPAIMIGEKLADMIKKDWSQGDVAEKIDIRIAKD